MPPRHTLIPQRSPSLPPAPSHYPCCAKHYTGRRYPTEIRTPMTLEALIGSKGLDSNMVTFCPSEPGEA